LTGAYGEPVGKTAAYFAGTTMSESKHTTGDGKADRPVPDALTVRAPAAQQMLGVAETTFWTWVRRGEIEVVRIGNVTLVPITALHDFLERHTVRAASTEHIDE
jgi:excisionase family DNA binding protein